MKHATLLVFAGLVVAAGAALIALRPSSRAPVQPPAPFVIPTRPEFYNPAFTEPALRSSEETAAPPRKDIHAVIVPHHLLAASMIARSLRLAAGRSIKTVVIIGPNHDDLGGAALLTADAAWVTPGGQVETDPDAVESLVVATGALRRPEAFRAEHSVGALVPFVERIFPGARIVPVIAASTAARADAEALSDWIAGLKEDTLAVFSIDFSHYLTEPEALRRDAETRASIERQDFDAVSRYGSEHLDAAPVLITALLSGRKNGWVPEFLDHASANDFLEIKSGSISTYFTILFTEKSP